MTTPATRHLEDYESVVNPEREIYRSPTQNDWGDLNEGLHRFI